ncbi:rna-directed dna polymerase from mobile element jockey-like protein [Lasius niger]|uniref:Rna-directed dna polymerase from mobile element jockey-like protein n=1 Tax=Lasius niger TaxID=67767 RepID=A0A0J7K8Y9_LASNI|nr:rna-directed dna polymerase from mobile element jockey-like protein [Lasius niger]
MRKSLTTGNRDRQGSTSSTGSTPGTSGNTSKPGMDTKIDWLINMIKEMRDVMACKDKIKKLIKDIVREELFDFRRELEELKRSMQENTEKSVDKVQKSFSAVVKEKKNENVIIVKPKKQQTSEDTKKQVKEKVDISSLAVGIAKLRKGVNGSVILGCESSGEIEKLKASVHDKLGDDFNIMVPKKIKPKIKIINVGVDEMNMDDANLLDIIKKQNVFNEEREGFDIKLIKRINKENKCKDKSLVNIESIYNVEDRDIMENFSIIDSNKLEQIVMRLPNKKGTDEGITSNILKIALGVVKKEYVELINNSLNGGLCLDGWKTSTIIPIPKIAKPKKASEYRPINILPIYEKVLELVIKVQLENYLEKNNVLTDHQSGFRSNHSCETAIQMVIDDWKLLVSKGKMIGVVFMDLKRAFETVDRDRLVEKLYQYGIRGVALEWLRSYLSNRKQQVKFQNKYSKSIATKYGVPQGSVLGPLLFIVYINDIVKACTNECNIKMFADDTLLYVVVNGILPKQLRNKLDFVKEMSVSRTRQADNIVIQLRKTSSAQKSLFYEGVKMYNHGCKNNWMECIRGEVKPEKLAI